MPQRHIESQTDTVVAHGADYSNERINCVALMDVVPGKQYQDVRTPPRGFRGWVTRAENELLRRARPTMQLSSGIRGHKVAMDSLMRAFLLHSQTAEFTFVVPDHEREHFARWASDNPCVATERKVTICGRSQVIGRGQDALNGQIWLNLQGRSDLLPRMRDRASSRLFASVTVMHGFSNHNYLHDYFLRTLLTPNYPCDTLVCTSNASKVALENIFSTISASLEERFGVKIRFNGRLDIIPLCVDTDALIPASRSKSRKELGNDNDTILLLFVGYMAGVKADLGPLLPIVRRLITDIPQTKLMFAIAGTGPEPYYRALLRIIDELGLTGSVVIYRDVSDALKKQLFEAADIFVAACDSLEESFGLTPVEAMSYGVPQVVADWNGYRDTVVDGETGFLVPTLWGRCDSEMRDSGDALGWAYDHTVQGQSIAFDVDCMYERLKLLIGNPDLRRKMSEKSRARAIDQYSYRRISSRYDQLWKELVVIAGTVRPVPKQRAFDEPAYFDCFKHDATNVLTDDCLVHMTDDRILPIDSSFRLVRSMIPGIALLDESLIGRLIEVLSAYPFNEKPVSVRSLVALLSEQDVSRDATVRHLLFLIKNGKLATSGVHES